MNAWRGTIIIIGRGNCNASALAKSSGADRRHERGKQPAARFSAARAAEKRGVRFSTKFSGQVLLGGRPFVAPASFFSRQLATSARTTNPTTTLTHACCCHRRHHRRRRRRHHHQLPRVRASPDPRVLHLILAGPEGWTELQSRAVRSRSSPLHAPLVFRVEKLEKLKRRPLVWRLGHLRGVHQGLPQAAREERPRKEGQGAETP